MRWTEPTQTYVGEEMELTLTAIYIIATEGNRTQSNFCFFQERDMAHYMHILYDTVQVYEILVEK